MSQNKFKDKVMNKFKQGFPKQARLLKPKFLPKSPQIFWIFAKFAKHIVQIINIEIVGINPFATFASKIHPWIDGSTNVQIVHVVVNFVQDLIIEKLFLNILIQKRKMMMMKKKRGNYIELDKRLDIMIKFF